MGCRRNRDPSQNQNPVSSKLSQGKARTKGASKKTGTETQKMLMAIAIQGDRGWSSSRANLSRQQGRTESLEADENR